MKSDLTMINKGEELVDCRNFTVCRITIIRKGWRGNPGEQPEEA